MIHFRSYYYAAPQSIFNLPFSETLAPLTLTCTLTKSTTETSSNSFPISGFEDEDDSQGLSTLDPGLDDHSSTFQEVADLITDGQEYLAAAGGLGGRGNADVSSPLAFKRGRPRFAARAEGSDGDFCEAELSLKTIADVGLVGFPNAGKSSLLGAVSSSTPEVAEYPFTTLHPYVGVVRFTDADRFTIADIPGLVEGASENKGLGHRFLRHVERTSALVFVLDASHVQTKSLVHDFLALVEELERYQPGLSTKPCLLLLNKVDVAEKEVESSRKEEVLLERWCAEVQALERDEPEAALKFPQIDMVLPVSAMQGYGIRDAVHGIRRLLEKTGMTMGEGLSR